MKKLMLLVIVLLSASTVVQSEGETRNTAEIEKVLARLFPGTSPDSIGESNISGLYEVVYGAQVAYISGDGRFVFKGDILDLQKGENISEKSRRGARLEILSTISEKDMIIFAPEKPKHTISIFTDIDCGYCRKLHSEIQNYNKLGIGIRYLSYPRSGIGSPSYNKAISVWCSKDRKQSITEAKAGQAISSPAENCDSKIIERQIVVAEKVGIQGTPLIVLEDGGMLPGFVPPQKLLEVLESSARQQR